MKDLHAFLIFFIVVSDQRQYRIMYYASKIAAAFWSKDSQRKYISKVSGFGALAFAGRVLHLEKVTVCRSPSQNATLTSK